MTTSRKKPFEYAEELLARHSLVKPPVDVERLAVLEGALLVRTKASGGESGFTLREPDRVIIGVNSGTSARRQRFTIGHEIGHLLMHEGRPLIVDKTIRVNYRMDYRDDRSSMATDREEVEANAFAAALLMPKGWIHESMRRVVGDSLTRDELINSLAREYEVSAEAMGYRLINLGIASA